MRPRRGGGAEGPAEPPAPGEACGGHGGNGRGAVGPSGGSSRALGAGPAVGSGPVAGSEARLLPRL